MLEIFELLNPVVFLVSFSVGTYLCYYYSEKEQRVAKKPTPANSNELIYKDKNGECYKYNTNSISCDKKNLQNLVDEESL